MKFVVILLSLCVFTLGVEEPSFRIYRGKETTIRKHPYQAALFIQGSLACGGVIINKNTIVTAAHCLQDPCVKDSEYTIRVGSTSYFKGTEYPVEKIIANNQYNTDVCADNNDYDIGIIKLAKPLTFDEKVQPIPLQQANTPVPEGTKASVTGWGVLEPNNCNSRNPERLREVNMYVLSNENCQTLFSSAMQKYVITDNMLCAKNEDRGDLHGDSGGPLVANGRLIGIVSWNIKSRMDLPHVYANVSAFYHFIAQYLN